MIPVLARIELLKLDDELIQPRPRVLEYWERMKERPSYRKVIGRYSSQLKMMKLIVPSICNVGIRSLFKKY
jgi:hypothetical protein